MGQSRASRIPFSCIAAAVALVLVGCAGGAPDAAPEVGMLPVVASFYPVQFLAERVGGDRVSVTNLTPPGSEPHDLALDGQSMAALADAKVVLYLGESFQPDVEKAVADATDAVRRDLLTAPGVDVLPAPADLGKESLAGGGDPHVWLDPVRMKAMASAVADAYTEADPANADAYRSNLAALQRDLDALDADLRADLTGCAQTTIVTSHAAFAYLADRYGLRQVAIAGLSPDAEPDAQTLAEITDTARAAGVTTVFFEEALTPDTAQTVASAIGAKIDLLAALEFDPREALGPGQEYLSVMGDNGDRLYAGLGCP
ncbi:metal ABC transporter substrate-binding protein [Pseudonocardia sichuanensis]|nr:zinc ABC transporter substrate-binding protein [Pseudonocardia kunmingensis]